MSGVSRVKRAAPIIGAVLLVLFLSGPLSAAETSPLKKSPTGAMLRSLVIPGWGQFYTENYVKALAFAAVEGSLIYSASHQHDLMKGFEKADDFTREKFYRNSRNKLLWWLAGTVLLSVGDAYVDAHLYGLDVSPDISLSNGTVGITVSCKL